MRRYLNIIFLIALFAACKKNDQPGGKTAADLRILRTVTYLSGGDSAQVIFDYDAPGRITKIWNVFRSGPPQAIAAISYAGNEVIINYLPLNNPQSKQVKLVLDAANRPLVRYSSMKGPYPPPASAHPVFSFIEDTTTYVYNAAGLPVSAQLKRRDTAWFTTTGVPPGIFETTFRTLNYTYNYAPADDILSSIKIMGQDSISYFYANTYYPQHRNLEGSWDFTYTSGFPNKTDHSNYLVLNDAFGFIDNCLKLNPISFSPGFRYLPNQAKYQLTTKFINGGIANMQELTRNYQLSHYSNGLLASVQFLASGGQPAGVPENIIYNQ